ncbi:hypothetical protein PUN49_08910 [Pseudomonas extremaustralis]|uniref:hypothetical protein n=1 Tax=Pseudomonas TaxID=286 RepID=UPI0002F8C896|nr:hypothetical protein [Pseudomonas extremaustralis]MDB1110614.1 hypothetical protein [Pseudomonas extremaustralis]MDF3132327.1 hypothetical protein [Pseudomonas extremaustralis]MDG2967150.1 hypothetical protein [Pseudomonas extremaustralis]
MPAKIVNDNAGKLDKRAGRRFFREQARSYRDGVNEGFPDKYKIGEQTWLKQKY